MSFHKFPLNLQLRQAWLVAMKRDNFNPSNYSFLCSEHFVTEDYKNCFGITKLKPDAVPSIFSFPAHLNKKCKKRTTKTSAGLRNQVKEGTTNKASTSQQHFPESIDLSHSATNIIEKKIDKVSNSNRKRSLPIYLGDFNVQDMNDPKKAKAMYGMAKKTIIRKNKVIKYLRNKSSRLDQRVKTLHSLLQLLKAKKMVSETAYPILQVYVG